MLIRHRLRVVDSHLSRHRRGQALTEFALITPLLIMVLVGIIVLGMAVFFQQQVTNAAREAARFAAVHSATAQCPTTSNLEPPDRPNSYYECDPATARWPQMTAHARSKVFVVNPNSVQFTACWSGYHDSNGAYDAPPVDLSPPYAANTFVSCTVRSDNGGTLGDINPSTGVEPATGQTKQIQCTDPMPLTDGTNDTASDMSASYGLTANEVSVFACFKWQPPLAGFLLIPQTVTFRAVITETLQYQQ